MKRGLLLLLCLVAAPVFAGPAAVLDLGVESVSPETPALGADLLVEVEGVRAPGEHTAMVTYFEGDEAVHVEVIRFRATQGQGEVLELLVWSDAEREAFINGFGERSVLLVHPDGTRETLRLNRILSDSTRWVEEGRSRVTPISVTTPGHVDRSENVGPQEVQSIFAASTCDEQCCIDNCYLYYDYCENQCGTHPSNSCLEQCNADFDACVDDCQTCPNTTEWTEITLHSETQLSGQLCMEDQLYTWQGPKLHYRIERTWKHTTYRRTEECDGSVTTTVIGVSYTTDECWKRSGITCSYIEAWGYCQYY